MDVVVISMLVAVVSSAITTKVIATYYFKVIDGYVKDMMKMMSENYSSIKADIDKAFTEGR